MNPEFIAYYGSIAYLHSATLILAFYAGWIMSRIEIRLKKVNSKVQER